MAAVTREITIGEMEIRFLLEGDETAGAPSLFEFDVAAGARVPIPHSHDGYEETMVGLEGVLTWTVDGVTTEVGPGDALFIPAASCTSSRTSTTRTRRNSRSSRPACPAPVTSATSQRSSTRLPVARPISPRSPQ